MPPTSEAFDVIPFVLAIYWILFENVQRAVDSGGAFWDFYSELLKKREAAARATTRGNWNL